MRKIIVLGLLLLTSCENQKDGSKVIKERYIYIKDTQDRCLKIDTDLSVYGNKNNQNGTLRVYEVTTTLSCTEIK